jgi:hypothetical protein
MSMTYRCKGCGELHDGIPTFGADRPMSYWGVPEDKRATDVYLTTDSCVIADRFFFVRGCLEIPIIGSEEPFVWGVWVSLKDENFFLWQENYVTQKRSHIGPFFGWLNSQLPTYPDTASLKTMVHLRDDGIRPYIELELSEHPLSIEQHRGITLDRAFEIVHAVQGDVPKK